MKHLFQILAILGACLWLTTGCLTHRHTVGDGPVGTQGQTEVYSRAKQVYIFWGLVPLGRPQPAAPSHGDYQIKSGFNVGDALLSVVTGGILQFRTIRIIVHKDSPTQNQNRD